MLRWVELRDQINIGGCASRVTGEGTMQTQMDNTGGLQLRFVLTQFVIT